MSTTEMNLHLLKKAQLRKEAMLMVMIIGIHVGPVKPGFPTVYADTVNPCYNNHVGAFHFCCYKEFIIVTIIAFQHKLR